MLKFGSNFRCLAVGAALLSLSGQAQAQSSSSPSLQQVADEAALAAVQTLAAGGTRANAIVVAQQTAAAVPGLRPQVIASPDDLVVKVKLPAANATTAPITSTARYLPPEQRSDWSWASRERFALKSSPVVMGAYCLRDCEPDSLR
jgi:hypothetical protein